VFFNVSTVFDCFRIFFEYIPMIFGSVKVGHMSRIVRKPFSTNHKRYTWMAIVVWFIFDSNQSFLLELFCLIIFFLIICHNQLWLRLEIDYVIDYVIVIGNHSITISLIRVIKWLLTIGSWHRWIWTSCWHQNHRQWCL